MSEKIKLQTGLVTREELEQWENEHLAPYAAKSSLSRGRQHPEKEHPYRTCFQRDRDRIIHSSAFRRLEYKTQVFIYHEGDYYRTRLTHSLEVAQIARTLARLLRLNEDLCETLALAHDLGHPPFGHAGESAMNDLMKSHGGFNHNRQGLRIVEILEDRNPSFQGMNLSWEVREGIVKHTPDFSYPEARVYDPDLPPTLEVLAVDKADEIAYNNHDLDDGLTSQMLNLEDLESVSLWQEAWEVVKRNYPNSHSRSVLHETIKTLINAQVMDLVHTTVKNLEKYAILSLDDVRQAKTNPISFSPGMEKKHEELKNFLLERFYKHYQVVRMTEKGKRVIRDLFETFTEIPKQLPQHIFQKIGQESVYRVVCDYIVGMTDKFALDEHERLFSPESRFLSP